MAKKKKFGISAYPDLSSFEKIEDYFAMASKYGCTDVFSSVLSVEGTKKEVVDYFSKFDKLAHKYGLEVTLDLNPHYLQKLGVDPQDLSLFAEIECDCARMDVSYGKENDLKIVNNPYGIRLCVNASTSIEDELQFFVDNKVDKDRLFLGHNSYPQRYTGLKWRSFIETNKSLSRFGFDIAAAISSNACDTTAFWDGIYGVPTVEKMRYYPIDLQARLLLASGNIKEVFISNMYASEKEFIKLVEALKEPRPIKESPLYIPFKEYGIELSETQNEKKLRVIIDENATEIEKYMVLDFFPQVNDGDSSEWIIRSRMGRYLQENRPIPPRHYDEEYFEIGSVLIVNDSFKHYAGEVQIACLPIVNDGTRNLVGRLAENEVDMIELLNDKDVITFLPYEKY